MSSPHLGNWAASSVGWVLAIVVEGCGGHDPSSAGAGGGDSGTHGSTSSDASSTGSSNPSTRGADANTDGDTTAADPSSSGGPISSAFITDPDGGHDPIECSVWEEDCPRGGKCMPWANDGGNAWNATMCSPLHPDPDEAGEPCTVEGRGVSGIDSCELHSMCWDVDPNTQEGTCVPMCMGAPNDPTCEDPDLRCVISTGGVLILCLPIGDPIIQD